MANDIAKFEGLRVYTLRDEPVLVDWYNQLITTGDHYQTFGSDLLVLSDFLNFFKPPRGLIYATDSNGIWFAYWVEPSMSGGFFGCWVRKDRRSKPAMFTALQRCFYASLQKLNVLIAMTKQPGLQRTLERLGFVHGMRVPGLWYGDAVDIYTMTRDQWNQRYHKRGQREEQRKQQ